MYPLTASRFFSSTGFAIGDDNMWTYFVRRGGQRTFGAPISRQFQLAGSDVQLFEKGMLALDVNGNVVSVNLLEDPLLPYDTFGDLRLPPLDDNLIASAPDPSNPDAVQEFIASNAACMRAMSATLARSAAKAAAAGSTTRRSS